MILLELINCVTKTKIGFGTKIIARYMLYLQGQLKRNRCYLTRVVGLPYLRIFACKPGLSSNPLARVTLVNRALK